MLFNKSTLRVGGKMRVPDSSINPVDFGEIVELTEYGIQLKWNKGTAYEQKGYISYLWLNSKYGDPGKNDMPNDPIPDMC